MNEANIRTRACAAKVAPRHARIVCAWTFTLAAGVVLIAGAGCSRNKEGESATPAASASVAPIASASPHAAGSSSGSASPQVPYGLALADRLSHEAATRPTDTPKAEDVLAAVVKSGVALDDQAQHLASPIGARFCIGAKSPQNVAMSACEYADAAAAAAGRDMSLQSFAKIEHRDVIVNKKTTLTILQAPYDAQSQAAHDKALAAFKTL
jgi:hypothetical protein